jgi:hypothetical protein
MIRSDLGGSSRIHLRKERIMQRLKLFWPVLLLALLVFSPPAAAQTEMQKSVVASGGGAMGTSSHKIICTVGQPCVGKMVSSNHAHYVGFLTPKVIVVSSAEGLELPTRVDLQQNYPNPFNPITTIRFDLPDRRNARLEVFSMDGRQVVTLVDKVLPPGRLTVIWDGKDSGGRPVASGIYLYRLTAGDFKETHRMVLVR